jgi:hypothetical protein
MKANVSRLQGQLVQEVCSLRGATIGNYFYP